MLSGCSSYLGMPDASWDSGVMDATIAMDSQAPLDASGDTSTVIIGSDPVPIEAGFEDHTPIITMDSVPVDASEPLADVPVPMDAPNPVDAMEPLEAAVPMDAATSDDVTALDSASPIDVSAPDVSVFPDVPGEVVVPPAADYCARITDRSPVVMYMASDDSNSVASAQIVRRLIETGVRVPKEVVRTHEMMNYYNPQFAPATAGSVGIHASMRGAPASTQRAMQVAIQSEARTMAEVRPMSLTFVIDTSASMDFERMNRARATVRAIAHSLRFGDVVSVSTWNSRSSVLLDGHTVTGPDDARLLSLAEGLHATWEPTDLADGLRAGYALAQRHRSAARLNRVVLISDGEANLGARDADTIARPARDEINGEVHLLGVSVGNGIDDTLMDRITDLGRGASVFIDRVSEADVMFGPRFVETMDVAVRAVRLELELPWYMRIVATSAEAASVEPTLVEPQYLAPNDAMVFQQVLQTCSASIANPADAVTLRATFRERDNGMPRVVELRSTMGALMAAPEPALRRGEAIVAYAEALKLADQPDRAAALAALANARAVVARALALSDAADLREIDALLVRYITVRRTF